MWKIKRNSNESQPAWAEEEHRTNTIIKSTRRVVVLCCSISKGRESRAHTQNSKHSRKGKENLQNIKYKKPSSSVAAAAELLLCLVYEYISISIESSLLVVVVVAPSRSLFFSYFFLCSNRTNESSSPFWVYISVSSYTISTHIAVLCCSQAVGKKKKIFI